MSCKSPEAKARERAHKRAYYLANRESVLERVNRYRIANKERIAERRAAANMTEEKKALQSARSRAWYLANRERQLLKGAEYRAANKEKVKATIKLWYDSEEGKAKRREYFKTYWKTDPFQRALAKYRAENIYKIRAGSKARKLSRAQRLPAWLTDDDLWMMGEVYDLALLRSKLTGVKYQVDHVIPLRGRNVPGLHVPLNLQVITARANRAKHNHYDVRC